MATKEPALVILRGINERLADISATISRIQRRLDELDAAKAKGAKS